MINKVGTFKDPMLDTQISEIVAKQFSKYREVTVTFTAASTETKADVGFKGDRFFVVDRSADIRVWRTSSDDRYMFLQASGAGTVTLKVWKS